MLNNDALFAVEIESSQHKTALFAQTKSQHQWNSCVHSFRIHKSLDSVRGIIYVCMGLNKNWNVCFFSSQVRTSIGIAMVYITTVPISSMAHMQNKARVQWLAWEFIPLGRSCSEEHNKNHNPQHSTKLGFMKEWWEESHYLCVCGGGGIVWNPIWRLWTIWSEHKGCVLWKPSTVHTVKHGGGSIILKRQF